MKEQRLEQLFNLYINRNASQAEETELMELLLLPELTEKKEALIEAAYDFLPNEDQMSDEQAENIFQQITKKQIPVRRIWWERIAVAASILLVIGAGSYFIFFNKTKAPVEVAKNLSKDVEAPKENKAVITLSNGQTVSLDSLHNGILATQGQVHVTKTTDGKIVYSGASAEMAYNTLSNPRGSTVINLTLGDGTKVWLNSESSLKYPVAFSGGERKVSISGEAYFEVAHNAAMPFKVDVAGKGVVEVLGTHFNVNAYADEPFVNTTLLEGSVQFSLPSPGPEGMGVRLTPGQEAQLNNEGKINVNNSPDIESITAWKNDKFIFRNADLGSIMRQLERWYDVKIDYKKAAPTDEFVGVISRNVKISEILKMLETTGLLQFEINGKSIIVK